MNFLKSRKAFESFYLLIAGIILFIVVLVENSVIALPFWVITKNDVVESSFMIFQVQVAVATFTLAILALITGSIKDNIYGVPVVKYAMRIRPCFLTYRNIMLVQMVLIAVSFVLVNYQQYNYLIYVFTITVFNSIILLLDIFSILHNYNDNLKEEIEKYLIDNPTINNISNLKEVILQSRNNVVELDEDLRIMVLLVKKKYNHDDIYNKSNTIYEECLKLLLQGPTEVALCAIKSITNLYSDKDNKMSVEIFEVIRFDFYKLLSRLDLHELSMNHFLLELHFNLFHNSVYDIERASVIHFTECTYKYGLLENTNSNANPIHQNRFKSRLYNFFGTFSSLSPLEEIDKLNYMRALIDNMDLNMLKEYIIAFSHIESDSRKIERVLATLYIYYLAERENSHLVSEKLKEFCAEALLENSDSFTYIIENDVIAQLSSGNISLIYSVFKSWELSEPNSWKTLICEYVANDFFVFSALNMSSYYELDETIGKVVGEKAFEFYTQFSDEDVDNQYKHFCNLFKLDYNEDYIAKLQFFLSEIYKKAELKKAVEKKEKNKVLTCTLEESLTKEINIVADNASDYFNKKPDNIITEHIKLCNTSYYRMLLEDAEKAKEIMIFYVYKALWDKTFPLIETKTLTFTDLVVPVITELYTNANNSSIDTLIGYRDWCSHKERNEFARLLEDYTKLNCPLIKDIMLFLSKSDFYINFSNLKIKLLDVGKELLEEEYSPNHDGQYEYTVTNSLKVLCSVDELELLINSQTCILSIEGDIEYGFANDNVGFGIAFRRPE